MKRVSRRLGIVLTALMILSVPTVVPAQDECQPDVEISLEPAVVERGSFINIAASLTNCSAQRLTIRYEISTPCTRTISFSVRLRVPAGTFSVAFPFPVFRFACPGEYSITVTIFAGDTLLDSDTATATVI
jgi:hypothetical protein